MKKVVKIIKNNLFGFLIGVILIGSLTYTVADSLISSESIQYNDTNSSLGVSTVKGALDKLYEKYFTVYTEELLNGADPVYSDNLIPVVISKDGTVYKADITTEWYNYGKRVWANAVMLNDNSSYDINQEIPSNKIKAFFVWIPKYKYKLFDMGNYNGHTGTSAPTYNIAKTIEIEFGTTNTTDTETSCETPMTSGASGNCVVGKWMTHPAFISMNTNGLWVGKYEVTGAIDNLTVLPNQTSVRSQTVKAMFEAAYNMSRDNDSHMMKNTEWGAVAYLSHSEYGINTEIRINNNSDYKTGYAGVDGLDQHIYPGTYGNTSSGKNVLYNTATGVKASTTGNISGIYDMSGGAHEYMASYMSDTFGSSLFDATSIAGYNSKYFDVYTSGAYNNYTRRILGDATGEMGPFYRYADGDTNERNHNNWYTDGSDFVNSSGPWFGRGGSYNGGVLAGQFYFTYNTGGTNGYIGFRLVFSE